MARNDRPPVEEPQRRSRLFWVCLLVLLMALVWTVLKVVVDSEVVRTVAAAVAGGIFVFFYRDRIWGPDWRDQIAAERAKQEQRRKRR